MIPVLLDTGVIVALLDRSETEHASCVATLEGLGHPIVTCEAVIAESCYLLRGLQGASEAVLENVERGVFQIPFGLLIPRRPFAAPSASIATSLRILPMHA